jgi:hypothetical protein
MEVNMDPQAQAYIAEMVNQATGMLQREVADSRVEITRIGAENARLRNEMGQQNAMLGNLQHNVGGNAGNFGTGALEVKPAKPKQFSGQRGTDAEVWLFRCEQFFDLVGVVNNERRVQLAASWLDDIAADWWRSIVLDARGRNLIPCNGNWDEFKRLLLAQFQPVNAVKMARDKLSALRQYNSVARYNHDFTAVCLQIPDINEAEKLDRYVRGLKRQIKVEIELAEPVSVADAMAKAQRIDNITYYSRFSTPPNTKFGNFNSRSDSAPMELGAVEHKYDGDEEKPSPERVNAIGTVRTAKRPVTRAQKVSREEFARCMKLKLCLRCKKPGHIARNCKAPQQGNRRAQ